MVELSALPLSTFKHSDECECAACVVARQDLSIPRSYLRRNFRRTITSVCYCAQREFWLVNYKVIPLVSGEFIHSNMRLEEWLEQCAKQPDEW